MLLLVIFSIVILAGIILLVVDNKISKRCYVAKRYHGEGLNILGKTLIGFGCVCAAFAIPLLISSHAEFEKIENEYASTKTLVENYTTGDYGNAPALMEKVLYLNEEIANHKAKSKNPWVNVYYSEKVGELEPIVF